MAVVADGFATTAKGQPRGCSYGFIILTVNSEFWVFLHRISF